MTCSEYYGNSHGLDERLNLGCRPGKPRQLCSSEQFVMKDKQLSRMERRTCIAPAFAVTEFDFEHTGSKILNHRADLSPDKLLSPAHLPREPLHRGVWGPYANYLRERNSWSAWESFPLSTRSKSFELSPFPTGLLSKSLTRTFGRGHLPTPGLLPLQQPPAARHCGGILLVHA